MVKRSLIVFASVASAIELSLGDDTEVEAKQVEQSKESQAAAERAQGGCCADTVPVTESHSCHNAHRKPKGCPNNDDAFTNLQLTEFDKLCKNYKEKTWYNNLLNCAVRRVVVVGKQAVEHIEEEDVDALMNYLLKMADISIDFDAMGAIPTPREEDARQAGVCLHKLWWAMMHSHEQVYNASIKLIRSKGGKDYDGPWGWTDGTCTHNNMRDLKAQAFYDKATTYALKRAQYAHQLRMAADTKKYYVFPFLHFFKMFSPMKGVKLKEIALTDKDESVCFTAIVSDVSHPEMMRSLGGIDQFMETKSPVPNEIGGVGEKCAGVAVKTKGLLEKAGDAISGAASAVSNAVGGAANAVGGAVSDAASAAKTVVVGNEGGRSFSQSPKDSASAPLYNPELGSVGTK